MVDQTWLDMVVEFEVRECRVCTSLIATDSAYGRKANRADYNVCECCDVSDNRKTHEARLRKVRKAVDEILKMEGKESE